MASGEWSRGARGPSKHASTGDVRPTEVSLQCVTTVTVGGLAGLGDRVKRLELHSEQLYNGQATDLK